MVVFERAYILKRKPKCSPKYCLTHRESWVDLKFFDAVVLHIHLKCACMSAYHYYHYCNYRHYYHWLVSRRDLAVFV